MIKRTSPCFSLAQICQSGQCFRMLEKEPGRVLIIGGRRWVEKEHHGMESKFKFEEEVISEFLN